MRLQGVRSRAWACAAALCGSASPPHALAPPACPPSSPAGPRPGSRHAALAEHVAQRRVVCRRGEPMGSGLEQRSASRICAVMCRGLEQRNAAIAQRGCLLAAAQGPAPPHSAPHPASCLQVGAHASVSYTITISKCERSRHPAMGRCEASQPQRCRPAAAGHARCRLPHASPPGPTHPADDCPRNCSGHGTCVASGTDPATKECQCDEGFGARDCSLASTALEFGKAVVQEPAAFERTLFQLPAPTGACC